MDVRPTCSPAQDAAIVLSASLRLNETEFEQRQIGQSLHKTNWRQQNGHMLKPTPDAGPNAGQGKSDLTLQTLFEAEESPLLRYAFSLTGRRAVAEELVQEVFLQLHARWSTVESPKAWLYRSVRNRAFNHLRNNRREQLSGQENCPMEDESPLPESELVRLESIAELRKTLGHLDAVDQELVRLKYFDELKYREISELTGLSVSNVGYRLHHILKLLATKLRPLGVDELS